MDTTASSPLKCMSPADVYLLLKSSDFVQHDLDPALVFNGCDSDYSRFPAVRTRTRPAQVVSIAPAISAASSAKRFS